MIESRYYDGHDKDSIEPYSWRPMMFMIVLSAAVHACLLLPAMLSSNPKPVFSDKPEIQVELVSAMHGRAENRVTQTRPSGSIKARRSKRIKRARLRHSRPEPQIQQSRPQKQTLTQQARSSHKHARKSYMPYRPKHHFLPSQRVSTANNTARNQGDRPPMYRLGSANNPRPVYPYLARKRGWQGRVVLKVYVNSAGQVSQVVVQQPSGYPLLDRVAATTIKKWIFAPSLKSGRQVAASLPVPVQFKLIP